MTPEEAVRVTVPKHGLEVEVGAEVIRKVGVGLAGDVGYVGIGVGVGVTSEAGEIVGEKEEMPLVGDPVEKTVGVKVAPPIE
jgi:hypothetical protein